MPLPCVCYTCTRCLSTMTLKDPECLDVEQKNNCEKRDCDDCDFTCKRYTTQPLTALGERKLEFIMK